MIGAYLHFANAMVHHHLEVASTDAVTSSMPGLNIQAARRLSATLREGVGVNEADLAMRSQELAQQLFGSSVVFDQLSKRHQLTVGDMMLLATLVAEQLDVRVRQLYRALSVDGARVGRATFYPYLLAGRDPIRFRWLMKRLEYHAPLRQRALIWLEPRYSMRDKRALDFHERRMVLSTRIFEILVTGQIDANNLDETLRASCTRHRRAMDNETLPESFSHALASLADHITYPVVIEQCAPFMHVKVARHLGALCDRDVMTVKLNVLAAHAPEHLDTVLFALRSEAMHGAALICVRIGDETTPPRRVVEALQRFWTAPETPVVLLASQIPSWLVDSAPSGSRLIIPEWNAEHRDQAWVRAFEGALVDIDADTLHRTSRRYVMTETEIEMIANDAQRRWASREHRSFADILEMCCQRRLVDKMGLFASVVPDHHFGMEDLLLPDERRDDFLEVLAFAKARGTLFNTWGFGARYPYGRGLAMLFYGPPGTGKTMAASIIAGALDRVLLRVDVSRVVSKYIGETEERLRELIDEAERRQVVLLFDEADSLFAKRTDIKGANDRYANQEVNYLLERMERFDGVAILTTNAEQQIDDAFKRRLKYRLYFPVPDADTRTQLWRSQLPPEAPTAPHISFELLGEHFELSGGHIKNAVLRAALYAVRESRPISMQDLALAAQAECRESRSLVSDHLPSEIEMYIDDAIV